MIFVLKVVLTKTVAIEPCINYRYLYISILILKSFPNFENPTHFAKTSTKLMFLNRNLHSRILVELEELDKVTFKSILVINAIEIHQKECNIVDNTKRMGAR